MNAADGFLLLFGKIAFIGFQQLAPHFNSGKGTAQIMRYYADE